MILGGSYFLRFLIWQDFQSQFCPKKAPKKLSPDHQMLKVRPFQNHRLRGKNRFDGLKNFGAPQNEEYLIFGAQKNEKIDFF